MNPWLRAAAVVGALALPLLWLGSLAGRPDVLTTNGFRVGGALVAAVVVWGLDHRRRRAPPRTRYLVAGVVGSLIVTALSVGIPALGRPTASGWLLSGIVGGGTLALVLYAGAPRPPG